MSDYDHSEAVISSHPSAWTVHVLGPDEVHTFPTAEAVMQYVGDLLLTLDRLYPRDSEFSPVIRVVVSPPTGVVADSDVAS